MEKERLLSFYKTMVKIRYFELAANKLFLANKLPGFLHLYAGQEAIATGVCGALNHDDYITSNHRGHGHLIAKGGDVKKMMAELFGKATGYCNGKGGSMHICDMDIGILGSNGIVGAGIPIAAGAAFGSWYREDGKVAVSFFGDGASNRGTFHEAMNFASMLHLPVIFVCENNLYGISEDQRKMTNIKDIADRAKGYGIPGVVADGNNIEEVYRVTCEAVERARKGEGPTLIEFKTWRHLGHYVGDPDNYRSAEEKAAWQEKDPIPAVEALLVDRGYATAEDIQVIKNEMQDLINEAIKEAEAAPYPAPETLMENIYAD